MTDVIVWAIYCDSFLGISVLRWLISAMSLVAAITPAQVTYIVLVDKTIDASVARHYKCYTTPQKIVTSAHHLSPAHLLILCL